MKHALIREVIAAAALAFAMPVHAQVVAVPDSGSAVAGTASTPIANVAGNDTVNSDPATLGIPGNATVQQSDSWPTGIALDPATGAISNTSDVAPGVYSVPYQLCDLNTPANCATTTDTVTITASIFAAPDSGSAVAGTASIPIANVTANDTVNGAQASLGTSGNSAVSMDGTWPTGIALDPATGAISTTNAVTPGAYNVSYQLCDLNTPANCATTADTVTVTASIVAVPDSGTADAGTASKAIANATANDTVNGAAATLGATGNSAVAKVGTWPTGVLLNTTTGAVTTTAALAPGTYNVGYQLCDKNVPQNCAGTTATVTVITPSIVAVPDSGSAVAGIGSRPIANVAANDSVNNAPATLGSSGNATVSKVNTWPAGIVLTASTGAITTTVAVPAGTYSIQYQVCDRNVPPVCVVTTDTVTVIAPSSIVAVPEAGSAVAGTAAKPISNVAANDTVNGAPATLGSSGNATIAKVGTWPAGITLNTSTGAITTNVAVPPGTFSVQYQVCNVNAPPTCATTTDTVTVVASIVATADAGFTVVGTPKTVIANVTANDSVNGAPAKVGASANATIAQVGSWPLGISLDTASGAVATTSLVPAATYSLQYQLCDLYFNCANAAATVTVTPQYTEVQATATPLGDIEFDWGRDGISCPTCNFGSGNLRANWTDRNGNLYVAHLDPNTGQFSSPGANDEVADSGSAFFWNVYGNGPEWSFSTQNGKVVSQLVYSRSQPGFPQVIGYTGSGYATMTGFNTWTPKFLPGAIGQGNGNPGTNNTNLPEGSQCNSDPLAIVMYKNFASPIQLFTEPVTSAAGTTPTLVPFTSNGIGERFVPCTHQLLFQADAQYGQYTFQQVFWYNTDTKVVQQLTNDPTTKYAGFMFKAPDFGGNYIFFTVADRTTIQVFQQTGTNANGSPAFVLVNSITSPDPDEPYMNSAEPFINCTPICTTYVFTTLAKTTSAQNGVTEPNGLAVVALSPATPMFNILVTAKSFPVRQRLDAEYFITPNGPYLYYNRIVPMTGSTNYSNQGEWYIDMQLGAPSGPCVGSSAQGGMMPGC